MISEAQLRSADRAYRAAVERAEAAREARDTLIARALVDGWLQAEIARAVGVSRGRVNQIAATLGERVVTFEPRR